METLVMIIGAPVLVWTFLVSVCCVSFLRSK